MARKGLLSLLTLLPLLSGVFTSHAAGLPSRIDLGGLASYSSITRLYGNYPDGVAGISVSAGDVNGDGMEDVIFGSLRADPRERNNAGEVYVVFGSKDLRYEEIVDMNDPPTGVLRIHGVAAGDQVGRSVAAGDMDGDGYADIIIGAWNASPENRYGAGAVYVLFGSQSLYAEGVIDLSTPRPDVLVIYGQDPGDMFGVLVYAGDVNGDGFSDAVIGAWHADPLGRTDAGRAYAVFGSAGMRARGTVDTRFGTGVLIMDGIGEHDELGYHVTAGDLNGDGFDDVVVGAPNADPNSLIDAGEAYILFGSREIASRAEIDLAVSQPGVTRVRGAHPGDIAGNRMNTGDVDGDGCDDLLVGAAGVDTPGGVNAGAVYVVFGSPGMSSRDVIELDARAGEIVPILGEHSEDLLSMPFSGDVDADGFDDVIVMAHGTDFGSRTQVGTGYVLFGSADFRNRGVIDLRNPGMDMVRIDGDDAGGYLGVSGDAGDIDGDGYADIIMGAHGSSPEGRANAGKVYVVWGNRYAGGYPPACHFSFASDTGDSATVLIWKDALSGLNISPGDEIGVFTPSGLCAGAGTWSGNDLSITVWGDDLRREGVNGFRNGEPPSFRVWTADAAREYDVLPVYASSSAAYWSNAVIEVASLGTDGLITGIDRRNPIVFSLAPNYPNPFNPATTITFTVPRAGRVTLAVYTVLGSKTAVLADAVFPSGTHRITWNAAGFAAGVYLYRIEAEGFTETRRMTLVK